MLVCTAEGAEDAEKNESSLCPRRLRVPTAVLAGEGGKLHRRPLGDEEAEREQAQRPRSDWDAAMPDSILLLPTRLPK